MDIIDKLYKLLQEIDDKHTYERKLKQESNPKICEIIEYSESESDISPKKSKKLIESGDETDSESEENETLLNQVTRFKDNNKQYIRFSQMFTDAMKYLNINIKLYSKYKLLIKIQSIKNHRKYKDYLDIEYSVLDLYRYIDHIDKYKLLKLQKYFTDYYEQDTEEIYNYEKCYTDYIKISKKIARGLKVDSVYILDVNLKSYNFNNGKKHVDKFEMLSNYDERVIEFVADSETDKKYYQHLDKIRSNLPDFVNKHIYDIKNYPKPKIIN